MSCGQCGAPTPRAVCRECEMMDALEEDFARERRVSKVAQKARTAICRSLDGEESETRRCIDDARRHWTAEDSVGTHLLDAAESDLTDSECRYHLRQAMQHLATHEEFDVEFKNGGAFA